jgi:GNAT superfamily N-acetyltransferase
MAPDRYLELAPDIIEDEHICCAFSDPKSRQGYAAKKRWLADQYGRGYRFRRLDARGKVFIEYVPAEHAWLPLDAPDAMVVNCFWVSGRFKGHGHGRALLEHVVGEAERAGMAGVVAVTGDRKRPFMSDPGFFARHGFVRVDEAPPFFRLWWRAVDPEAPSPRFLDAARAGGIEGSRGIEAYYSATCPFTEHWAGEVLPAFAQEVGVPCRVRRIETREQARALPIPWVIHAVFYEGAFVTLEMDSVKHLRAVLAP